MPYGLSVAPRTFTKLIKEVVSYLRYHLGFTSVIYHDDILCIGESYEKCLSNVRETLRLLDCLGFVVNYNKSNVQPQQYCRFLGFIYNSIDMTMSLPTEKRNDIVLLTQQFSTLPKRPLRDYARLIGVLVAACLAVKHGWLYTKQLEREKFKALQQNVTYNTKVRFSNDILADLDWWANISQRMCSPIGPLKFDLEVFTDASLTGWGAFANNKRVNGAWKDSEQHFHINYLELLAVFCGLKCFCRDKSN